MKMSEQSVGPFVAVVGAPERCPACGGELAQAFGMRVENDGRRYAVIDPSVARCRDCWKTFPIRQDERP